MATKMEQAIALYKSNHSKMTNGEIVKKIMADLDMTEAGARTYAYNAKKALGVEAKKGDKKTKTKAPAKAKTKTKATVDKKTGKLTVTKETVAAEPQTDEPQTDEQRAKNAALFSDFHNKKIAANNEPAPYSPAVENVA